MPKRKNPFYILLLIVGTAFGITAFAYMLMTVRMGDVAESSAGALFFDQFFDQYGLWLMGGELTLLTLLTFAAIATDDYWTRETDGEPQVRQTIRRCKGICQHQVGWHARSCVVVECGSGHVSSVLPKSTHAVDVLSPRPRIVWLLLWLRRSF